MTKNKSIIIIVSIFILAVGGMSVFFVRKHLEREKLTALYKEGLKMSYKKDNPFFPDAMLPYLDSLLAVQSYDRRTTAIMLLYKATVLLNLGEEKKAIELLKDIVDATNSNKSDKLSIESRNYLALAYLRLAEKNNCVMNHSAGSCVFPIQGNGVYVDPSASQKSIDVYQDLLKQNPDDLESQWLLNLAYMTIGEYPKEVPSQYLIQGLDIDTSSYKVNAFQDMATPLKLNVVRNMAGGSIIDDFNNDGYLDIITSCWGLDQSMHFYKNNANGTFSDVSEESGLSKIKGGLNIIQADYNNDGNTDIFILRGAWQNEFNKQPNTLLRNNGDGTFTDVTVESGLLLFNSSQTAVWADFNNDGWLDLFIGNETVSPDYPHPCSLYINNHDGTFTEVGHKAGSDVTGYVKGVTSADYNNDGWPDIFISSLDGHKMLLKNKGIKSEIPQFQNVTHEANLDKDTTFTFPTWFWDYDNDGWPDIFACGYQFKGSLGIIAAAEGLKKPLQNVNKMELYRNNHDGTFTNVSKNVGLDRPVFAMGSNFGDIDNDGWLDMYLGTGNPDYKSLVPNKMFKNIDGKKFADVTASARVGNLQKGHAVSFGDVDNDGDQDIFIEVGGAYKGDAYYNSFYVNPGQNNNNWISILLEGVESNRSAIGARIEVRFVENGVKRIVYRDVNSGGSFGSSPLRKEIGIGKAEVIDELVIKWPTSGKVQIFKNIKPRQFLKIKEDSNEIQIMDLKVIKFDNHMAEMNMVR
jgi:tetratricopeptide (TPR) repeat protein